MTYQIYDHSTQHPERFLPVGSFLSTAPSPDLRLMASIPFQPVAEPVTSCFTVPTSLFLKGPGVSYSTLQSSVVKCLCSRALGLKFGSAVFRLCDLRHFTESFWFSVFGVNGNNNTTCLTGWL